MKKYVITGGPCSGKTSVINEIEKRGFDVSQEIARGVIEKRKNLPSNQKEKLITQKIIFEKQKKLEKEIEENIRKKGCLFLDRGLPDSIAYWGYLFDFVPEGLKRNMAKRYDGVFILERLPFKNDGLRIERGDKEAKEIHDKIIQTYKNFGYSLIIVPVMPVEERADFVLDYVQKKLKGGK